MTKTSEVPYEVAQLARHRSQDDASQVSQAAYERLVETSPDAIIIHNGRRILFANSAAAKLVGLERTPEMIVRSLRDFIHPDDRQIVTERAVRMAKGEVLPPVELRIVRLDGSEIEAEANGTPIAMPDGSRAIQVVIRDLTERRRLERWFRGLLESAPDAMVVADCDGHITFVNSQTEKLFGYATDELLGNPVEMLVPARFRKKHSGHRAAYARDCRTRPMGLGLDLHGLRKDGSEFPVEISLSPLKTAEGSYIVSAIRDVTERSHMQAWMKEMSIALESAVEGISRIDRQGRYTSVNAAYARMLGYEPSELIGADWLETVHRDDHPTMQLAHKELAASGRAEAEVRGRRKDGSEFHQRLVLVAVLEGKRKLTGHYQFMQDISARRFNEEMIRHMAYHDPLTSLPNRRLLHDRFRMALAQARRTGQPLAVVSIDIDNFKKVNDNLGHAAGDHVLRTFARRLEGALREGDTLGRVGGDEFLLLLPNADRSGAAIVIGRCRESGAAKIIVERRIVYARFSAGVSTFPEDGDDPDALMKAADAAMYLVKPRRNLRVIRQPGNQNERSAGVSTGPSRRLVKRC